MDPQNDLKPSTIVPIAAAAAAAGSLMLTNCEQSPLGKLMEQYNRLASESRIASSLEEKLSKEDLRTTETVAATAITVGSTLVDTIPYTSATATVYSPYSWSVAAAAPWWTNEPTGTWPTLPYSPTINTESAATTYSPYLGPQFQGLLSAATVSAANQMVSISNAHSSSTGNALSKISNSSTTHAAGGKLPTRSNCECPNCKEIERSGNSSYLPYFPHSFTHLQLIKF